jgi:integrase
MARTLNRLSALQVKALSKVGLHNDGGGLYLQISPAGTKSWKFRYTLAGRVRDMGLGALADIPLADARELAAQNRRLVKLGTDPIEQRRQERAQKALEAARAVTFQDMAAMHIAAHSPRWRSAKHAKQWEATLRAYAFPVFGSLPVQAIDTNLVMKALEPIWQTKTETAGRVRERIEAILDAAKARGFREGENPARWRGHLDNLLPRPSSIAKVNHFRALPYAEIASFMATLRQQPGQSPRALELLILTATRTSETLGARWAEIDLMQGIWVIPANRIKAAREHRIPLSAPAIELLTELEKERVDEYVFPGGKAGKPLSNMALITLLHRMGRRDIVPHGFRSTFRDWAAEQTGFPREVAEAALAHAVTNKVEAAYRRGDLLEKRRRLMAAWAAMCEARPQAGAIVRLHGRNRASG